MATINPAWPLLTVDLDCTVGPPKTPGLNRMSLNSLGMGVAQLAASRGRQYELGNAEAGTASVSVNDPSELLNPANTASPLNTGDQKLLPYRAFRVAALWPHAGNIINPGVDSSYDSSFETGTGGFVKANSGTAMTSSTAQAFVGTHSLSVVQTPGQGAGNGVYLTLQAAPGITYTASGYVYIPPSPAGTTVRMEISDIGGSAQATSSGTTGVWQRLTVTYEAAGATLRMRFYGLGNSAPAFFVDAIQSEIGSTASAYTAVGPTLYGIHTGYVERYPQTWRDQGMWGVKPLQSVDALSVLSRTVIRQTYADTVADANPMLYMPLSDSALPQQVQRSAGGAPLTGFGQLGVQGGSVNFAGDAFLDGSPAVKVVQQNTDPPIAPGFSPLGDQYVTMLGTRDGEISMNTQSFSMEMWVKPGNGTPYIGVAYIPPGTYPIAPMTSLARGYGLSWYTSNGRLTAYFTDSKGVEVGPLGFSDPNWNGSPDGKWHYLVLQLPGGNTLQRVVDDVIGGFAGMSGTPQQSISANNIFFESTTAFGDQITDVGAAHVALYPRALTTAELQTHYQRGIGYLGELTLNRASRILSQYWAGAFTTTSSGVVPMAPDFSYNGRAVLDVLQEITVTDNGLVYVTGAGQVVVEGRDARYRKQTAQWVFGERADLGEKPYTNMAYDYDPTYLYAEAQVNRPGGPVYSVVNQDALTAYGQRVFTRTLQAATDWEAQQAAIAFALRYGEARLRVQSITIDPSSNPALWPVALGVEVSQRVTVNRRTGAGVTVTGDYFIERVSHAVDSDSFKWTVTLQLSPVFVDTAWILGDSVYGVLGSTTVCVY